MGPLGRGLRRVLGGIWNRQAPPRRDFPATRLRRRPPLLRGARNVQRLPRDDLPARSPLYGRAPWEGANAVCARVPRDRARDRVLLHARGLAVAPGRAPRHGGSLGVVAE